MLFSKKGKLIYHVVYKKGVKTKDVIKKYLTNTFHQE